MKKCRQCGYTTNSSGQQFCPVCGSKLEDLEINQTEASARNSYIQSINIFSNQNRKPYDNLNRIEPPVYMNTGFLNIKPIVFLTVLVIVICSIFSYVKSDKMICKATVTKMFKEIEQKEQEILTDYVGFMPDQYAKSFIDAINAGLSYKVRTISVHGDTASALVVITNAELVDSIEDLVMTIDGFNLSRLKDALSTLHNNESVTTKSTLKVIIENIKKERAKCQKIKISGEVTLEKENGSWEVIGVDSNVISGFIGVQSIDGIILRYIGNIIYGDDYNYNDYSDDNYYEDDYYDEDDYYYDDYSDDYDYY